MATHYRTLHDPVGGPVYDVANGINDIGQIVGTYDDSKGEIVGTNYDSSGPHNFVENHGSYTTVDIPHASGVIGAFSVGLGINDAGHIVGFSYAADTFHGFLFT